MEDKSVMDRAKEKLLPLIAVAKLKMASLLATAKLKSAPFIAGAKNLQDHPQIINYRDKISQKSPIFLASTVGVAVFCIWAMFAIFADSKPSDELIFETITADGGNGLVYDAEILSRDGYKAGDNQYVVAVDYEITWKMDQEPALEIMMKQAYKEMKAQGIPEYQIKMALMFGGMSVALKPLTGEKPFKAGDRQKISESYTFVEAESGWRLLETE